MSYSWFSVENTLIDHPKTMALRLELSEPLAEAYLLRLWCWTHRYAPSGLIPVPSMLALEQSVGWRGGNGILITALRKTGWIDEVGGEFFVHDWPEYQSVFVEKSIRDAKLKRKKRAKAARAGLAPGARAAPPTLRDETRRDGTKPDQQDLLGPLEPKRLPAGDPPKPKAVSEWVTHFEEFQATRAARFQSLGLELVPDEPANFVLVTAALKRIRAKCHDDDELWELFSAYMRADAPASYEPPYKFKAFTSDKWWANLLAAHRGEPKGVH